MVIFPGTGPSTSISAFRVLADDELGPGLRAVRETEAAHGLDPALRVVMRRELDRAPTATVQAPVLVRQAQREDVRAAAEVYLRSRHAAVAAIPPLVHDDGGVRAWFAEIVFAERELWIAEHPSGAVIGLIVLDGDFVDQLYVDPRHTGAGVGSQLLGVAQSLRPAGLQLWTFQSNEGAKRFYDRHGFVAVEWTDGAGNEERAPDVRYVWKPIPSPPDRGAP